MEINDKIQLATNRILEDYQKGRDIDKMQVFCQPDAESVRDILKKLLMILCPGYYRERYYRSYNDDKRMSVIIEDVSYNLQKQIALSLPFQSEFSGAEEAEIKKAAEERMLLLLEKIPSVREVLDTDLQAFFEGDPAAYYKEEIVLSYPGFQAVAAYRLAHELYLMQVPMLPRMMAEDAHSRTGIDIHPGASIGRYFFLDHGTGIVIGETAVIGDHVKIYQGVTIGALSTRGGQKLQKKKRHPTIEDRVTIYSGASILGGETRIGSDSVIGSNVFITETIPAGSRVSFKLPELMVRPFEKREIVTS